MKHKLILDKILKFPELSSALKGLEFRGLYTKDGKRIKPYKYANFSFAKIYPPEYLGESPQIVQSEGVSHSLFTPQPTIYQNQIDIMEIVDDFLHNHNLAINRLKEAVSYHWEGRGSFHVMPPVIEKHTYEFKNGYIDLDRLSQRFKNTYIKDAQGNLHHLAERFLNKFHIDEVSNIDHLDIFNSNMPIINYGLRYSGKHSFYIICDGSHRIDYAIEKLNRPITALVVEPIDESKSLIPYYALPVTFNPTLRLTSKQSEKMYPRLERDKIHLLNDFIKKALHYDWECAGLNVSKLRSNY
jgi:hypothetical protein